MRQTPLPVCALLAGAVLCFLEPLAAQWQPLPGVPMTAPPVDHPALAAQPLFPTSSSPAAAETGGSTARRPARRGAPGAAPAAGAPPAPGARPAPAAGNGQPPAPPPPAPPADIRGVKKAGKDLKKAVATVAALQWHERLDDAKARSAATGKPILWIQSLGDLEGFA